MRLHEIETNDLHAIFDIEGTIQYNDDGSINIIGEVSGMNENIKKIPVKFNEVSGYFICGHKLTTLEGCPRKVGGDFYCDGSNITSFDGGPEEVVGEFWAHNIKTLVSLTGLPKSIKGSKISLTYDDNLPLLRLCLINDLTHVSFYASGKGDITAHTLDEIDHLEKIIHRYLRTGRSGAIRCAAELTKAGFKGNARL